MTAGSVYTICYDIMVVTTFIVMMVVCSFYVGSTWVFPVFRAFLMRVLVVTYSVVVYYICLVTTKIMVVATPVLVVTRPPVVPVRRGPVLHRAFRVVTRIIFRLVLKQLLQTLTVLTVVARGL